MESVLTGERNVTSEDTMCTNAITINIVRATVFDSDGVQLGVGDGSSSNGTINIAAVAADYSIIRVSCCTLLPTRSHPKRCIR